MRTYLKTALGVLLALSVFSLSGPLAHAAAIHDAALFTTNLPANDDGSTGLVNIGFSPNFFGTTYTQLFVNNNGNVTFNAALSTFTPFPLLSTGVPPIIAPFFGDVDTRGVGSSLTQYGQGTIGGQSVFGVNWINVGYFNSLAGHLNSFQLIMTDRSNIAPGDFDFEFNNDQIQWETGQASGSDVDGLGGSSARAGWSNGNAITPHSFEIAGSAVNGALLDTNATSGLIHNSLNSSTLGQYVFHVRNGEVEPPPPAVPEPISLILLGIGLAGLGAIRRRKAQ